MSEAVFDIIAKDPQIPHVAEHVQPAGMQEHGREEGNNDRWKRQIGSRPGEHGRGNNTVFLHETFQGASERQLIEEDDNIDYD
jgi:hypothetical protein